MLFELRQYRCHPGKRDEFVALMEERLIPAQIAAGVAVVGTFVGEDDPDAFVWIRRFESEAHRAEFYDAFYGGSEWNDELRPIVHGLVDREQIQVTRLEATRASAIH